MPKSHHLSNIAQQTRKLMVLWTIIVHVAIIMIQTLSQVEAIHIVFVSVCLLLFALLNWFFVNITQRISWLYFLIQLVILCIAAYTASYAFGLITVGLFPLLIGQFLYVYYDKFKIATFIVLLYMITTLFAVYMDDGVINAIIPLALFTLMNLIITGIVNLMLKQYYARMRTQNFLDELEIAHRQVEELTVANERQRMARDLHDTLAQGLVGIIMQLEAINVHIGKQNYERAQHIVLSSMEGARHTLAEAREVIDNLRLQSQGNIGFSDSIRQELRRFNEATGITIVSHIEEISNLPKLLTEHSLYILRESLTNITRHAQAQQVEVNVNIVDNQLKIEVIDDGKGFDPEQIGRQAGHYGLIGIQERVRIMSGQLLITKCIPRGTHIHITIPLEIGG